MKSEAIALPISDQPAQGITQGITQGINALASLYGGKVARQRDQERKRGLSGNIGQEEREQTVLTPRWLIDALLEAAAYTPHSSLDQYGHVGLDPCTTPENPVGAKVFLTASDNGLPLPWSQILEHVGGIFYCNPPYDSLEEWLVKASDESKAGAVGYMLAPFRPHRRWFCALTRGQAVVSLAPVKFVGHKQGFPAPLCVIVYGLPVPKSLKDEKSREYVTGIWSLA